MERRRIVGIGGAGETEEQTLRLYDHVLSLTGRDRPRVLFVPTAVGDAASSIGTFYDRFAGRAEAAHLPVFPWPPPALRDAVLRRDAICVSGGNTANMLAIWRVHGIDALLREAWEEGVLVFGGSAGMICWFEHGVTDSFGPRLEAMDCLGWLPGSACPHYDGEPLRRPRYRELIAAGLPPGVAAEEGVALVYTGTELAEAVSCRPGAAAYAVDEAGERRLATRLLGGA